MMVMHSVNICQHVSKRSTFEYLFIPAGFSSPYLSPSSSSKAINACVSGSEWSLALASLPADADVIALAGALSGCERGSHWAGAIHWLGSMPQLRLRADEACNQSATWSCA